MNIIEPSLKCTCFQIKYYFQPRPPIVFIVNGYRLVTWRTKINANVKWHAPTIHDGVLHVVKQVDNNNNNTTGNTLDSYRTSVRETLASTMADKNRPHSLLWMIAGNSIATVIHEVRKWSTYTSLSAMFFRVYRRTGDTFNRFYVFVHILHIKSKCYTVKTVGESAIPHAARYLSANKQKFVNITH